MLLRIRLLPILLSLTVLNAAPLYARKVTWLDQAIGGEAFGVSADGRVVVGYSQNREWITRPFIWTKEHGMRDLGFYPRYDAQASAVSTDGSVVVGNIKMASQDYAFRWTRAGSFLHFQLSPINTTWAFGVSADGNVIVGMGFDELGNAAFRWTPATGVQNPNVVYRHLLPGFCRLSWANAVSSDGRFIVGWGYGPISVGAFLLETWPVRTVSGNLILADYQGDLSRVPVRVEFNQGSTVVRRETIYC